MPTVLLLGATSDIAQATAHRFAREGYAIQLAARHTAPLESLVSDLSIRYGIAATAHSFDATQFETHLAFYQQLSPAPDVVISVFGYLGDQQKGQENWRESLQIVHTNYVGAVSILNVITEDFVSKNQGTIVGISSVAGDRGRGSNYLYGSAKAGFTAYLSGLRNRLHDTAVTVVTIKPGFVRTQMTAGLDLPALLTAQPEEVAQDIYQAVKKKKLVVYTKWYWRWIMLIIRLLPESLFKKLRL